MYIVLCLIGRVDEDVIQVDNREDVGDVPEDVSVSGYLRTTSRCQDAGLQGMSESCSVEKWILAATGGSYRAWQDWAV
jgi:hypothetical protein